MTPQASTASPWVCTGEAAWRTTCWQQKCERNPLVEKDWNLTGLVQLFLFMFFLASLYVLSNNTTIWCLKTTQTFKNFKAYEERAPLIRAAFISTKNCDRKKFWASKHTSELDNLLVIHDDIILVLLFSSIKTWSFYWWFSRKEYIFHRKEEVVGSYNLKITPGDSDIHCACPH